jgi:hypothetical protein
MGPDGARNQERPCCHAGEGQQQLYWTGMEYTELEQWVASQSPTSGDRSRSLNTDAEESTLLEPLPGND